MQHHSFFFTKNKSLYLLSINSGKGNNIHTLHETTETYTPYICYLLTNDINTNSCITIYSAISSIGKIYDFFVNGYSEEIHDFYEEMHKNVMAIHNLSESAKILDSDFCSMKLSNNYNTYDVTKLKHFLEPMKENQPNEVATKKKINCDFYTLLNTYFLETIFKKEDLSNKCACDLSKFKHIDNDYMFNKDIFNKVNLHYYDTHPNDLFIIPQQSGSCSWFSIYWAILLYYVLCEIKIDIYIKKMKYVIDKCYNIIQKVYTIEHFKQDMIEKRQIVLMRGLCKKLIDLKVLNNNILDIQQDIIYDIPIDIHTKKINTDDLELLPIINFDQFIIKLGDIYKFESYILSDYIYNLTEETQSHLFFYIYYGYLKFGGNIFTENIISVNDIDNFYHLVL
jgi:hypothetical protein